MDEQIRRLTKLQNVLDVYERQLKNLQDLGEQINEDHKKIYFYVEHEDEIHRNPQQMPFFQMVQQLEENKYKKPPEFEPFYMEMRDHYAMHFIGILMTGLKEQREIIQDKIKMIKQEIKEN